MSTQIAGISFTPTPLQGAYVLEPSRFPDNRGYLSVAWNAEALRAHGLNAVFVQANFSYNAKIGTLRGMHAQKAPYAEDKLIRCMRGAIYDAIVDIRPESPTYLQWFGVELTAENGRMLYVPRGFLHGFQTLANETEVLYQVTNDFHPEAALGARFDDPAFGIAWPDTSSGNRILSEKDESWPPFRQ